MATGSKHKILEVSRDLFYRRGYLATSVDDILAEAKVSKSNFYYHFKSKEDLGIAVLDHRRAEFEAALASTLCNDALSPLERLSAFLKRLSESREAHASSGCPFGNLIAEMSDHSERFRHELSRMFSDFADVVARTVADGQRAGQFRNDVDPHTAGALVVQTVQGAFLLLKCQKTRGPYVRGLDLLVLLLQPVG